MNCSKCGKIIEEMGQFGGLFSPAASVQGIGDSSDFDMWRAQVCTKCRLVFCGNCLKLGRPTPCPECGNPTVPAYKGTINAMGSIRKLNAKTADVQYPPEVLERLLIDFFAGKTLSHEQREIVIQQIETVIDQDDDILEPYLSDQPFTPTQKEKILNLIRNQQDPRKESF